jgi:hypothetical protein
MFWHSFVTAYALRPKSDRDSQREPNPEVYTDAEPSEEERWIVCRQCRQRLTRPGERLEINGSHSHTFANPSGVVFEIGCFRLVSNVRFIGPPSYEFPWFSGYSWQIVICGACQTHLGWHFQSQGPGQFFGLILERLLEIDAPPDE